MNKIPPSVFGTLLMLSLSSLPSYATDALTPPASWSFATDLDGCSIINADPASSTFEHGGWRKNISYYCSYGEITDEYLILPTLSLKSGHIYEISYSAYASWYRFDWNPTLSWAIGKSADNLGTHLTEPKLFDSSYDPESCSFTFTVAEDGDYVIGAHLTADESQGSGSFYISGISIDAGTTGKAPSAPELVVTPAISNGALVMHLSLTMPSTLLDSSPIDGSLNYTVSNKDGRFNMTGTALPSETVVLTDTGCDAQGETYIAYVTTGDDVGKETSINCTPVFDRPAAPQNVIARQDGDIVNISWDAVTNGENDGLFIPSDVVYTVQRSDRTIIANKISDISVTDTPPMPESGQASYFYTVTAYKDAFTYTGNSADSNELIVGNPYSGQFSESFASGKASTAVWSFGPDGATNSAWQSTTSNYSSPYCSQAVDNDGGFLLFNPSYYDGTDYYTPLIELTQAESPTLELSIFAYSAAPETGLVKLHIVQEGAITPIEDGEICFYAENDHWENLVLRLPATASDSPFRILLEGLKPDGKAYKAIIDAIRVYDQPSCDASITDLTIPEKLMPGDTASISVTVANEGATPLADVTLTLNVAGETMTLPPFSLSVRESESKVFQTYISPFMAASECVISATVSAAGDVKGSNDTKTQTAYVGEHQLPVATIVSAIHADGGAAITWNAPEIDVNPASEEVTESFENWTVGSTEPMNGWIFIDADKKAKNGLAGINVDKEFAFFVAEKFSTSSASTIEAADGNNALVTTRNADYSATDSWLISPVFDPTEPVSFMATAFGFRGYDTASFEVGYLPAGTTDIADFIKTQDISTNGYDWEGVNVMFPEDASRFVIHAADVQTNAFAFDRFVYHATPDTPTLNAYNIWRNGELIASVEPSCTSYIDTGYNKTTDNEYHMSCVYEPSRETMEKTGLVLKAWDPSGIGELISEQDFLTIEGRILKSDRFIEIFNSEGIYICSLQPDTAIELQSGIYIIRLQGKALKIFI